MDALTVDRETYSSRIDGIQERVAAAAARSGRNPDDITIVAVSKTFPREAVDAVYAAGLSHFGENRVQEAAAKYTEPLPSDLRLHLIGQLQTNKVKPAVALFDRIETVDRPSLIAALEKEAGKHDTIVNVLLQVNIAREPQKSGCDPDEAASLVERIAATSHLRLDGLMAIAPLVEDREAVRAAFRAARELRDALNHANPGLDLRVLSMGMSGDFDIAVEEGATHIRVGSAIFGNR